MLIIHILIALFSLGSATFALITPTQRKLFVSYVLVALTLASGTYLVISLHAPLVRTCESGLAYLAVVGVLLAVTHYRLAALTTNS